MNNNATTTDKLVAIIEYRQPLFDAYGKDMGYRLDGWNVFADPSGMVSVTCANGAEGLFASVAAVVRYIKRHGFTVEGIITADSFG